MKQKLPICIIYIISSGTRSVMSVSMAVILSNSWITFFFWLLFFCSYQSYLSLLFFSPFIAYIISNYYMLSFISVDISGLVHIVLLSRIWLMYWICHCCDSTGVRFDALVMFHVWDPRCDTMLSLHVRNNSWFVKSNSRYEPRTLDS